MLKFLANIALKIWGFSVIGPNPNTNPKYILLAGPHTSNWDFPLGILVRLKWSIPIGFLGKKSLFKKPFGFIFKGLGGHPVDRKSPKNIVDQIAEIYNKNESFAITIAPEGTRKKVDKLKSGFYFICKKAQIPIVLCKLDYKNKVVEFSEAIWITEKDLDDALQFVWTSFASIEGKNPEWGID